MSRCYKALDHLGCGDLDEDGGEQDADGSEQVGRALAIWGPSYCWFRIVVPWVQDGRRDAVQYQ